MAGGDKFDAVMNYPFTDAVLDFFIGGSLDAEAFANAIGKQLSRYPLQASEVAFNLLDSHDTARLLTLAGGDEKVQTGSTVPVHLHGYALHLLRR